MTASIGNLSRRIRRISWASLFIPRIEDLVFISIFLSVIVIGPRLLNMDGDIGRHITIGSYILDNGKVPIGDIFSHTMAGLPLTPHEWFAQLIFAVAFRLAGLDGIVVFCAFLIAITFTLVFRQAHEISNLSLASLVLTVIAAAAASIHWLARPHLFTLLFVVLWIGELKRWKKTGRWRWWVLPLLMLFWVNSHGAFIVGILILGIYLIDLVLSGQRKGITPGKEKFRLVLGSIIKNPQRVVIFSSISVVLLTLLNPVGWRIWETTMSFLGSRYLVSHTFEYQPPDFQKLSFLPFLISIALSVGIFSLNRKSLSIADMLLLTTWTVFGLVSARNIPIYAVIAVPILAGASSSIFRDSLHLGKFVQYDHNIQRVEKRLLGYLWPAAITILVVGILFSGSALDLNKSGNRFSDKVFPVKAVEWASLQPDMGLVFNYFPWGGYLLYTSWPQQRVFIDGQTDFYGEPLTRKYEEVISIGSDWEKILAEYQVSWILMPQDAPLVSVLATHPAWRLKYADQTAVIYAYAH
ncbi:MAG: hypothetical protein JSV42_17285 [Chloroflexota bacterium]|nr:MAG: hypothetical protein JSV42_17285 [Chloroflexota bacterium]